MLFSDATIELQKPTCHFSSIVALSKEEVSYLEARLKESILVGKENVSPGQSEKFGLITFQRFKGIVLSTSLFATIVVRAAKVLYLYAIVAARIFASVLPVTRNFSSLIMILYSIFSVELVILDNFP